MTRPELHLDFETRGVLDLREVGLYNYARHRHTSPWCAAFAFGDEEPRIIGSLALAVAEAKHPMFEHVASGGIVVAHNAPFELAMWNEILAKRYGWPEMKPEQTICTMAMSYAMGLPGALEDAGNAVGLEARKDKEGRSLMLRMARPRSKPGQPLVWWDDDDKLARLFEYCKQDVRVEQGLYKRLVHPSPLERRVWLMDYAINQRGVCVDVETARSGINLAEKVKDRCNTRLAVISKGAVTSCTAVAAMKEWLDAQGCPATTTGLTKQAVEALIANGSWAPEVIEALTLRQEAGRASTAKLLPMVEMAGADGRMRNIAQYHGAATGRWAGRGIQPHNFPRDVPNAKTVEHILALVRAGDLDRIDILYGPPMEMLSKCLRGFLMAGAGNRLIAGDWSAIESRGGAWFAGEQWKLDAFVANDNGTGPGIYELAYAKSFGVPVENIKNPSPERQIGKIQELAFQYQGGVGAARVFLPPSMQDTPDSELEGWRDSWRAAHPRVKKTWYQLQNAAMDAVRVKDTIFTAGAAGRQVQFIVAGSFLWCKLPSGRLLCYPYPRIVPGKYGDQLSYMAVPGPDKTDILYDDMNANNWARISSYGGSLMENVIQAICRDILALCMLGLHEAGAGIVLHVHDEIVVEVAADKAEGARADMQRRMRTAPEWAAGFPLHADCKTLGRRYGKG